MKIPWRLGFMLRIKLSPNQPLVPINLAWRENWWCLWYRWRKYLILIRIRLNFFLVLLLLLLLFLVLLLAREKERLWTLVSKWGGLFLCGDQVCWNAIRKKPNNRQESHHLSLVKLGYLPYHQNNVSSVETLWTWEKQAHIALYVMANTLCPFCKQARAVCLLPQRRFFCYSRIHTWICAREREHERNN